MSMIEVNCGIDVKKIKKEVAISHNGNRSFEDYAHAFSYEESSLKGKLILDVGSGMNDSFSKKANAYNAEVISFDAKFSDIDPRIKRENYAKRTDSVAGLAQCLPFKDEVFDETIGLWTLDWISIGREQVISEMIRVTKLGGKIKIHPVLPSKASQETQILERQDVIYFLTVPERVRANLMPNSLVIRKNPQYSKKNWNYFITKAIAPLILHLDRNDAIKFNKQDIIADNLSNDSRWTV